MADVAARRGRSIFTSLATRLRIARLLFAELASQELEWLLPLILALMLVGLFLAAVTSAEVVAPFLYPLL